MSARICAALAAAAAVLGGLAAVAGGHVGPLPGFIASAREADQVPPLPAQGCPTAVQDDRFAGVDQLVADDRVMNDFGPRPTASPAHTAFVDWVEQQLEAIPGLQVGSVPFTIDRWLETGTSLAVDTDGDFATLPTSGAVPYAKTTPVGGVTAPLVYVPVGTPISSVDVAGKIVVRDVLPGSTPFRNFNAVMWFKYDPDGSLTQSEASGQAYQRDFSGNAQRVTDLQDAADGRAAGLIMVHGFPRAQVKGQYAPYEGVHWDVPALYVGSDEGARLKQLAAEGGSARMSVSAADTPDAPTRMLVATLPGATSDRMIVESHTDGMNAVWDNGPIAMLALARYFAALPQDCRPRTLQFVFTTGHLYQRLDGDKGGSAALFAAQLDSEYDQGGVALVFAIEHLGAREYLPVARTDGGPGQVLEPTGRSEVNTMFTGDSPVLINATERAIVSRDLARTYLLQGADAPAARIPVHQSFGGEGSSYQQHLIPTIAFVTGPWTLYDPAFGMEAIDGVLMRKQALVFADLITGLASVPSELLGGGYLAERAARSELCGSGFSTMGFVTCTGGGS